jgi:hypothetical protein
MLPQTKGGEVKDATVNLDGCGAAFLQTFGFHRTN